jgi:acyl-CoA reductase-like NAD-dependent aldehyde dehydrogenase
MTDLAATGAAIERAASAFVSWRMVDPAARLLRRFASLVDEHLDELAQLEVVNAGHTWERSGKPATCDVLNYYAGAPERR